MPLPLLLALCSSLAVKSPNHLFFKGIQNVTFSRSNFPSPLVGCECCLWCSQSSDTLTYGASPLHLTGELPPCYSLLHLNRRRLGLSVVNRPCLQVGRWLVWRRGEVMLPEPIASKGQWPNAARLFLAPLDSISSLGVAQSSYLHLVAHSCGPWTTWIIWHLCQSRGFHSLQGRGREKTEAAS